MFHLCDFSLILCYDFKVYVGQTLAREERFIPDSFSSVCGQLCLIKHPNSRPRGLPDAGTARASTGH